MKRKKRVSEREYTERGYREREKKIEKETWVKRERVLAFWPSDVQARSIKS